MTEEQNKPIYVCEVCQVFCSSVIHLSDHIGGVKHRNAMKFSSQETLEKLSRLQYFPDTYLKDEPMIGLEYVVERLRGSSYMYKCMLCNIDTPRGTTILHLSGAKHRRAYLVSSGKHSPLKEGPQSLKSSSEHKSDIESNSIVKNEIGYKLQYFRKNDDFLDYLRNFEIQTDDDASFIQEITKNCTSALMKFREEQTKTEVSSVNANSTDQKTFNNPSVTNSSASTVSLPKETSTPASILDPDLKKNDTTEAFFTSITNMDASEVINVFQKIAATNPAFRGINIPSLMNYLQETGRLKNS